MNSETKIMIKKIALKTVIALVVQLVVYILYRFCFENDAGKWTLCWAVLLTAAVTIIFKVNPQYWLGSDIFLYILFDSIPSGGGDIFSFPKKFGDILMFLVIAVAEPLMSIIAVSVKAVVLHIRCRNRIKLIISDNECESAKKVYDENGVIHSFFLYDKIRKCCAASLKEEKIKEKAEVSLTIVSNEEIKELNLEHRGKDSVTDVLSFPLGENGEFDVDPETNRIMLGDIVISAERAAEQAKEYGHTFEREMCFLATHSMFHLLGYDHEVSEEEEKIMFDKQKKVLDKLGINR